MANEVIPEQRMKLRSARVKLGLSREDAAQLIGSNRNTVRHYENGIGKGSASAAARIRSLCVAYQQIAEERGYDPLEFHESVLAPGEFPQPRKPEQGRASA